MEFNEYQNAAHETLTDDEQVLTNLAIGLASESGSVLELIQNYTFRGHDLKPEQLTKELGDVLWYISQIAEWANISFEEVAMKNLQHVDEKYKH